jgi:hypothetical protein
VCRILAEERRLSWEDAYIETDMSTIKLEISIKIGFSFKCSDRKFLKHSARLR